jgi:hypothetical protein
MRELKRAKRSRRPFGMFFLLKGFLPVLARYFQFPELRGVHTGSFLFWIKPAVRKRLTDPPPFLNGEKEPAVL